MIMASPVPAKSQPLHNFSLPHLKWKKNHTNNHLRGRKNKQKDTCSKIYIRLRKNNPHQTLQNQTNSTIQADVDVDVDVDESESAPKTWNLRPRRPLYKLSNINKTQNPPAAPQLQPTTLEKKEHKQIFSISLSPEEMNEDIFVLTGSKPQRRPKKRPRVVQKQLDNLFPGLWLDLITPDSYKVSEAAAKD